MTSSWHSYPSIYNMGHKAIAGLLTGEVVVEEKIDGSQISWGVFQEEGSSDLEIKIRSKGAVMNIDAPEKMFSLAAETVKKLAPVLHVGWTYRGEYLRTCTHNTLHYDRIPKDHIIIFDINRGEEDYLNYDEKAMEAARIGLEVVPRLHQGTIANIEEFRTFLDTVSILGGQRIEGVVIKQRGPNFLYGLDHKVLIGKFVSEVFKEAHVGAWKEKNPGSGDILTRLGEKYCHTGRWLKAAHHLRDLGQLENSPRDIGKLIIEVHKDLGKEEEDSIKESLWKWAIPHITRSSTRGLAEWWKEELLKRQFDENNVNESL